MWPQRRKIIRKTFLRRLSEIRPRSVCFVEKDNKCIMGKCLSSWQTDGGGMGKRLSVSCSRAVVRRSQRRNKWMPVNMKKIYINIIIIVLTFVYLGKRTKVDDSHEFRTSTSQHSMHLPLKSLTFARRLLYILASTFSIFDLDYPISVRFHPTIISSNHFLLCTLHVQTILTAVLYENELNSTRSREY